MNPQDMMTASMSLFQGHGRDAALLIGGAILSNPITCAQIVFMGATKIPGVGPWVGRHPEQVKGWFDGFDRAIDACVDKYTAQQAAASAETPVPSKTPAKAA